MNVHIQVLAELQQLIDGGSGPASKERYAAIERMRATVPSSVLSHFDRMIARGKKGVAFVRHGVCTECHLRIASGTVASLAVTPHLVLCETCGSYLMLAAEEAEAVQQRIASARAAASRKAVRVARRTEETRVDAPLDVPAAVA
jgi:hypothetical protein